MKGGVQAIPSCRNLGLERLVLVARLAPRYEGSAASFFNALSEHCYLCRFARVMLRGEYLLEICVPPDLAERCAGVYMDLERAGMFTALEVFAFDDTRESERGPDSGRGREGQAPSIPTQAQTRYDEIDLLIVKEMVRDASQTPAEMAERVRVSAEALRLHREHVMARGLVSLSTSPSVLTGAASASDEDEGIELSMILESGTSEEVAELSEILHGTPYLSSESHGSDFWAEALVPKNDYPRFLRLIDAIATRLGSRLRILVIDQRQARRLMNSCRLYDAGSGRWSLDSRAARKVLGAVLSLARVS